MLEKKNYTLAELSAYLQTKGKSATDKKLKRYGITYTINGQGRDSIYTITGISDPFRVLCVFDLMFDPHTDFAKLRDFFFYLLGDPDFAWRPLEMMEEYLRIAGHGISRQTLSKYVAHLDTLNIVCPAGDTVYYKVHKRFGVQEHEIITKEEYSKAWSIYWDCRRKGYDTRPAYNAMYSSFGGVPRKQRTLERSAFYLPTLDLLEKMVTDSFLAEYGHE